MVESRGIKVAFIAIVIAAFITLDLTLALFVINWSRKVSILLFAFLVFFNFSFSLMFSKKVLSFFVKPDKLPKLEYLTSEPKAAILYATMNDVVPESLMSIWQTYPSDVYVLDNSTSQEKREIVDRIAEGKGFKILRWEHRQGFKAGAINNWIQKYGRARRRVSLGQPPRSSLQHVVADILLRLAHRHLFLLESEGRR